MCLYRDSKATKALREKLSKQGFIIAWKVVDITNGEDLCSAIMGYYIYQVGRNKCANTNNVKNTRHNVFVGIHTYINKVDALRAKQHFMGNYLWRKFAVIPVKCYEKDLIAAGDNHDCRPGAVFKSVYISKEAYMKATA